MRMMANDVQTRVLLTNLLVKIDQNPKYSKQIDVENTSRFQKKEGKENDKPINNYSVYNHTF